MICPSCGVESQPGDRYCQKCGDDLYPPRSGRESGQASPPLRGRGASTGLPMWAVTMAVFFFFIAGGYGVLLMKGILSMPFQNRPSPAILALPRADTHLRILQPGDEWTFDTSVTNTDSNGVTTTTTGIIVERILWRSLAGHTVLADQSTTQESSSQGAQQSTVEATYFKQDSSGDILQLGLFEAAYGGKAVTVAEPQITMPGDLTATQSSHSYLSYSDGTGAQCDTTLALGPGNRVLPTGKVTYCWNVDVLQTQSDGRKEDVSGIFSPSIGNFLHYTDNAPVTDNGSIVEQSTLVDYRLVPARKSNILARKGNVPYETIRFAPESGPTG